MINVHWVQPIDLPSNYTKSRIYRSAQEQEGYSLLAEINTLDPGGTDDGGR